MDRKNIVRGTSLAILAASAPAAITPAAGIQVNEACGSSSGFIGCCSDPGSWCQRPAQGPLYNYVWWDGLNCPKT